MLRKDEFVILNIWEESRTRLIERLDFYHAQAKTRVRCFVLTIEGVAHDISKQSS